MAARPIDWPGFASRANGALIEAILTLANLVVRKMVGYEPPYPDALGHIALCRSRKGAGIVIHGAGIDLATGGSSIG